MTDVLIVAATIVVMGVVFLPMLARSKPKASRINCVSRLKQIGLGFRIWSNDNVDEFPWAVSTNKGGTLEYVAPAEVYRHFQAAANELSTPNFLVCEPDRARTRTTKWNQFNNSNLSYFIGLTADVNDPVSILSGDRNLTTNGVGLGNGVFQVATNATMGWTAAMHNKAGNILLADGSVQQTGQTNLQTMWEASTNVSRRLAIP